MSLHKIETDSAITSVEHRENYSEILGLVGKNTIRQEISSQRDYGTDTKDGYAFLPIYSTGSDTYNNYAGYDVANDQVITGDWDGSALDGPGGGSATASNLQTCYIYAENTDSVDKKISVVNFDTCSSPTISFWPGSTTTAPSNYVRKAFAGSVATADVSSMGIVIAAGETITIRVASSTGDQSGDQTPPTNANNGVSCTGPAAGMVVASPLLTFVDDTGPTSANPGIVTTTIPSGTFSSTTSSVFGTSLTTQWESGASITYSVTSTTDDTGYQNDNEISEVTAFTNEPDELNVKLTPKSSTPTDGYPSIKGYWVVAR